MFYDFHVHSALSPCAELEMTPNNMVNMALVKGLNLFGVTDHNSLKQTLVTGKIAKAKGLKYVYGAELQTQEEVHVLALFQLEEQAISFQTWIDQHLPHVPNNPEYFGQQILYNEQDEVVGEEPWLLINSLDQSIEATLKAIHEHQGLAILAHVLKKKNSIVSQLGFIPEHLDYDGLELQEAAQLETLKRTQPYLKEVPIFINSDAHRLVDICEAVHSLTDEAWDLFWRKAT